MQVPDISNEEEDITLLDSFKLKISAAFSRVGQYRGRAMAIAIDDHITMRLEGVEQQVKAVWIALQAIERVIYPEHYIGADSSEQEVGVAPSYKGTPEPDSDVPEGDLAEGNDDSGAGADASGDSDIHPPGL